MEGKRTGQPHSVIKALSKASGRKDAKAVCALINWANAERDDALTQRSAELMRPAIHTLKTALPATDPELIGGVFANLLDLWETSQKLENQLQKLKKLRFPEDLESLKDILLWISAIQLDMGSYWIAEVKKDFPKLLDALDATECKRRRPKRTRR